MACDVHCEKSFSPTAGKRWWKAQKYHCITDIRQRWHYWRSWKNIVTDNFFGCLEYFHRCFLNECRCNLYRCLSFEMKVGVTAHVLPSKEKNLQSLKELKEMPMYTYYVPTIILVFTWAWLPLKILAIPKSEILGFISSSKRMLAALRSRWMMLSRESWWRYAMPLAVPNIILCLFSQSNRRRFSASEPQHI